MTPETIIWTHPRIVFFSSPQQRLVLFERQRFGVCRSGGIALIGMGNLGGFLAPNVKVWADEYFRSQRAGLYLLAGLTVLNAGLIALTKNRAVRSSEN